MISVSVPNILPVAAALASRQFTVAYGGEGGGIAPYGSITFTLFYVPTNLAGDPFTSGGLPAVHHKVTENFRVRLDSITNVTGDTGEYRVHMTGQPGTPQNALITVGSTVTLTPGSIYDSYVNVDFYIYGVSYFTPPDPALRESEAIRLVYAP